MGRGGVVTIEQLLARVEQLEQRVAELEAERQTKETQVPFVDLSPDAMAEFIVKWATSKERTEFTLRELFESVKGRVGRVSALHGGLHFLVDQGRLRLSPPSVRREGRGRKPSPKFTLVAPEND